MTAVKFLLKLRLEMSIEQQNNKTMTSCSVWLLLPIVRFYSMLLLHITELLSYLIILTSLPGVGM